MPAKTASLPATQATLTPPFHQKFVPNQSPLPPCGPPAPVFVSHSSVCAGAAAVIKNAMEPASRPGERGGLLMRKCYRAVKPNAITILKYLKQGSVRSVIGFETPNATR